jgi:hypothetical protein
MKASRCPRCRKGTEPGQTACTHCGAALSDALKCAAHAGRPATGVCRVCETAFCAECGKRKNGYFLCGNHAAMPVIEGMAGVFGGEDELSIRYLESILKEAGLHPHLYIRRVHPISPAFHMIGNLQETQGRISNAILILVPFNEVLEALSLLKDAEV